MQTQNETRFVDLNSRPKTNMYVTAPPSPAMRTTTAPTVRWLSLVALILLAAASIAVGNAAAGACGTAALAAKAYNTVSTVAGMAGATQNIVENGKVGVGDALAFLPALTFDAQRLRGVQNQCFVEGTDVLTGSADASGTFSETPIQDLQVGDLVPW